MDLSVFLADKNEKPLDRLVTDGGFTGIFRSIACIGDSLSSGEFEKIEDDGSKSYHDLFDFSWGQYIARMAGVTVTNMSRGGMTASEYCESFGNRHGYFAEELAAGAYIIALGENDIIGRQMTPGSIADINPDKPSEHPDTFAGWYGEILLRYRKISPDAKFFLVTMPRFEEGNPHNERAMKGNAVIREFAENFDNTYLIDLWEYAPVYDEAFRDKFFLVGHLNPMGYMLTAKMFCSYIDYIVRHNTEEFKKVGFIPAQYKRTIL